MHRAPGTSVLDLIGIGAVNLDYVVPERTTRKIDALRTVDPDREEPFTDEDELEQALRRANRDPGTAKRVGGSAFNVVHTLGRLKLPLNIGFVGVEGAMPSDVSTPGRKTGWPAADLLAEAGVDDERLDRRDVRSGVCVCGLDGDGRRLKTWPGANALLGEALRGGPEREAIRDYLLRGRVIHVTSFLDPETPQLLIKLLDEIKAERPTLRISVDPGHSWVCEPPPGFERLLQLADYLLVNLRELVELAEGEHDELDAAQAILERCSRNCSILVLKLREGATLFEASSRGEPPRMYRAHRDPGLATDDIGAGDAFAAAFLAGRLLTDHVSLAQSAHLAARVAAARVMRRTPDWYEPVAQVAAEFFDQLPPPALDQPDGTRYVLDHGDTAETMELIVEMAPRFYDAACHLRTAVAQGSDDDSLAPWTEAELQALVKAMLAALFRDVTREDPGPKHGGRAHRVDVMIRGYGIAIELELASAKKRDGDIRDELHRHFGHYAAAPNVKAILGLVFDSGYLENPFDVCAACSSDETWGVPVRTVVIGRQST